jgi:hypothetical protein
VRVHAAVVGELPMLLVGSAKYPATDELERIAEEEGRFRRS